MAISMFDGKNICFSAFSVEPSSEEMAFYTWLKANAKPASVGACYWGGEAVANQIPPDVIKIEISGRDKYDANTFAGYDIIVRHPSTRPDALPIDRTITSASQLFFDQCKNPIIAVTGTKGKGTTASLIAAMLNAGGRKARLIGNIGTPAINALTDLQDDEIVVFEISSFQLWDLTISPHIAVVLMIAAEHMDVHKDMREYVEAKSAIARHQRENDFVIYHPTNEFSSYIASLSDGKKIKYFDAEGAMVAGEAIMIDGVPILGSNEVGLLGKHNLENICAALTAAWIYTKNVPAIAGILRDFKGLEHRIEFVSEVGGVSFYNDSFATTPESTMAAVEAVKQPKILIVGGSSKGANFNALARNLKESGDVKAVIAIGVEGPNIIDALKFAGADNLQVVQGGSNMAEIIAQAMSLAVPGDAVLLSPACASFDMFANYKERGFKFKDAVRALR